MYAWTFLVPAVAVVIEAFQGQLPGLGATIGVAIVILGVAIVNHPRAEQHATEPTELPPVAQAPLLGDTEPTI